MTMLVGRKAPEFRASAVIDGGDFVDDFSLEQFIGKKHVLFYFYPLDLHLFAQLKSYLSKTA